MLLVFFNAQHNFFLRAGWLFMKKWFKNHMELYHKKNFQLRDGQYGTILSHLHIIS